MISHRILPNLLIYCLFLLCNTYDLAENGYLLETFGLNEYKDISLSPNEVPEEAKEFIRSHYVQMAIRGMEELTDPYGFINVPYPEGWTKTKIRNFSVKEKVSEFKKIFKRQHSIPVVDESEMPPEEGDRPATPLPKKDTTKPETRSKKPKYKGFRYSIYMYNNDNEINDIPIAMVVFRSTKSSDEYWTHLNRLHNNLHVAPESETYPQPKIRSVIWNTFIDGMIGKLGEDLRDAINSLPRDFKMIFAGHSLGGSFAHLAAEYWENGNLIEGSSFWTSLKPTVISVAAVPIINAAYNLIYPQTIELVHFVHRADEFNKLWRKITDDTQFVTIGHTTTFSIGYKGWFPGLEYGCDLATNFHYFRVSHRIKSFKKEIDLMLSLDSKDAEGSVIDSMDRNQENDNVDMARDNHKLTNEQDTSLQESYHHPTLALEYQR